MWCRFGVVFLSFFYHIIYSRGRTPTYESYVILAPYTTHVGIAQPFTIVYIYIRLLGDIENPLEKPYLWDPDIYL